MRCSDRYLKIQLVYSACIAIGCCCGSGTLLAEDFANVPGTVIHHSPASSGLYIGSPSIAQLPDGVLVASHDEFGPKSAEHLSATTRVYSSTDGGEHWEPIAKIEGQFWWTLFAHDGALYLIGTNRHHGNIILRRSDDGGVTWTTPHDASTGLLAEGEYHCALQPTPRPQKSESCPSSRPVGSAPTLPGSGRDR